MTVMINRPSTSYNSGSIVVHNAANQTYVVVGNSTVSNIATGSEVVVSASIAQAWWGVANGGYITVARGSNTVAVYTESGYTDYAGAGASLGLDGAANVVITITGAPSGYVMLELQKLTSQQGNY